MQLVPQAVGVGQTHVVPVEAVGGVFHTLGGVVGVDKDQMHAVGVDVGGLATAQEGVKLLLLKDVGVVVAHHHLNRHRIGGEQRGNLAHVGNFFFFRVLGIGQVAQTDDAVTPCGGKAVQCYPHLAQGEVVAAIAAGQLLRGVMGVGKQTDFHAVHRLLRFLSL